MWFHSPSIPETLKTDIPVHAPTWGLVPSGSMDAVKDPNEDKIKSTWLGHACFLVEMPARNLLPEGAQTGLPARGARILFDPVFSERCSPVQIAGPKRFTSESTCEMGLSFSILTMVPQRYPAKSKKYLKSM
jgi:N-acyl-phosphatidylethanolamine-hydrolysing phospholipase D